MTTAAAEKGAFRHYMLKEIYEQPSVLADTLHAHLTADGTLVDSLGAQEKALLARVECIHIVACGTSYHAGQVARYWIEAHARIPCHVELANEYAYRNPVVPANCLFLTLSQSGETADTLAALRHAQQAGYLATLAICNVLESSLVRESDLVLMTHAGPEIGIASTKAFTAQLLVLYLLAAQLVEAAATRQKLIRSVRDIADEVGAALQLDAVIHAQADKFASQQQALFLGRGPMYPIAMEGALKLKETSYIHAEAYAGGEMRHGPMALIDENMLVVAVAPHDAWLERVKAVLQEVSARGGQILVFADNHAALAASESMTIIEPPRTDALLAPICYTLPLQLFAYHVAVAKGTNVDQPRNLEKSVAVT